MSKKRIVITGLGVASSIGIGKKDFWKALISAKNGLKQIKRFDLQEIDSQFCYEISEIDYEKYMKQKPSSYMDRGSRFLLVGTKLALSDSSLDQKIDELHSDIGVVTGTQYGCIHSNFDFHRTTLLKGPAYVNPMRFPSTLINFPSSMVSLFFKTDALNTTIASGTAAGADAVGYACQMIKDERAKIILASGLADVELEDFFIIHSQKHRGFQLLPDCPGKKMPVVKPFDKSAEGLVLGESAAVLVLEELDHAEIRGANIYAEILGYKSSFDTDLSTATLKDTMQGALDDASLNPESIDYISASANGWLPGDKNEAQAINEVFANNKELALGSIKSMVGELCGASAPTQTVSACFSINKGVIPPTLNFHKESQAVKLNGLISNAKMSKKINFVMVNSFGYDGNNASLVIGKYS